MMMRWRPWPPAPAKKFQVRLVVRAVSGLEGAARATAVIRWKGTGRPRLRALRRTVKKNCTREEEVGEGGVVEWDEEFVCDAALSGYRENVFYPWEIAFHVFNVTNQGPKDKASAIGSASLNLAEFTTSTEEEIEIKLALLPAVATTAPRPLLHLTLRLLELVTFQESSDTPQRLPAPLAHLSDSLPSEKDELSAFRAGLRKVKYLREFVSARKSKKALRDDEGAEGSSSSRSDDAGITYPFDTDSLGDDPDEGELEDHKIDSSIRKSFSYGTLASGYFHSNMVMAGEYEDWVYYSHRKSDVGCSHSEEMAPHVPEQYTVQIPKRSILPWKKRKFSLRSPKAKGEPLLKKAYGEEGGDDIDYDRRQLSSSDESLSAVPVSEFGDDYFEVGSWGAKEIVSRDGSMKLSTQVFFASIDQRSERAAGESACTALVAVIADWFQENQGMMPLKSQLDSLIRDGSREWRSLCENQTYQDRFPDKHFDLETVLEAKIRPLSVVPERSFIGFFHPEASDSNSGFEFLHGAMSFDNIWDEITRAGADHLYIVSWNDHFFVLKVESDSYYIIDTLGERLHEGCSQAYILKFDESTSIHKADSAEEEVVCKGKEACKEYIKSFLAAIPIRELQADIKKGRMASTPLHHRLQIEFHYTETSKEVAEVAFDPVEVVEVAEVAFDTIEVSVVPEVAFPKAYIDLTPAVEVV